MSDRARQPDPCPGCRRPAGAPPCVHARGWQQSGIQCPGCRSRATWSAPPGGRAAYICTGCDGCFALEGQSFTGYAAHAQLSDHDRQRVAELRRHAGCGGNGAVGAFG